MLITVSSILMLLTMSLLWSSGAVVGTFIDYHPIAYENEVYGYSIDADEKDSADGVFNQILEEDIYTDYNYSDYTDAPDYTYGELIVGTYPDDLDVVDNTVCQFRETNTGGAEDIDEFIYPDGDANTDFSTYPASPSDHYSKVDDVFGSPDYNSTYNDAVMNGDWDAYSLGATSWDGVSGDVWVWIYLTYFNTGSQGCHFYCGFYIGGTKYMTGGSSPPNRWDSQYMDSGIDDNPATSTEWTLSDLNNLVVYIEADDASPDIRFTQVIVRIQVLYPKNYGLDFTMPYESIYYHPTGTYEQTLAVQSYSVTTSGETFGMYVWNNTSSGWTLLMTITWGTSQLNEFTFREEYVNGSNEFAIRFLDNGRSSDTIQSSIRLDYVNIETVRLGYDAEVEFQWEDLGGLSSPFLSFKGYVTAGEYGFTISLLEWGVGYDVVWNITDTSSTWHNQSIGSEYISSGNLKVDVTDNLGPAGDTDQNSLYIDYLAVVVEISNNAPTFTSTAPTIWQNNTYGEYAANATDIDEDPLTYDLEGSITTWADIDSVTGLVNGTPSAIGQYWMNISVTDGIETVWQNTLVSVYTLSPYFTSTMVETCENGTTYTYQATAVDPEGESLVWDLEGNGTTFLTVTQDGLVSGLASAVGWYYVNVSITDGTNTTWQYGIVTVTEPVSDTPVILAFILAIVFGLGVPIVGHFYDFPHYLVFGGVGWLFASLSIYNNLNNGLMLFGMALGVSLMLKGAIDLDGRQP